MIKKEGNWRQEQYGPAMAKQFVFPTEAGRKDWETQGGRKGWERRQALDLTDEKQQSSESTDKNWLRPCVFSEKQPTKDNNQMKPSPRHCAHLGAR